MTEYKGYAGLSESQLRVVIGQMFSQNGSMLARPGVLGVSSGALLVSQTATASGSVQVAAGMAACQDTALHGMTPVVNDSDPKSLDVFTANPPSGSPRNDIVVADSVSGTVTTITGAANATPTDPTVPATATPLARLRILGSGDPAYAGGAKIDSAHIDDLRVPTVLRGVSLPVTSKAQRDALTKFNDLEVTRRDIGNIRQVWNGTIWETQAGPAIYGTKTANGNVANNTSTDVTWDTYKTRRGASGGAVTFTPGLAGVYEINGYITWTPGNSGVRAVQVIVDGNSTPAARVDDDGTMNSSGASIDYTFTMPVVVPNDTSTVKLQVSYYGSTPSTLQILSGSSFAMKFVCDL